MKAVFAARAAVHHLGADATAEQIQAAVAAAIEPWIAEAAVDAGAIVSAALDRPQIDLAAGTFRREFLIAAGDQVVEVVALGAGETLADILAMALAAGERIAARHAWDGPIEELSTAERTQP